MYDPDKYQSSQESINKLLVSPTNQSQNRRYVMANKQKVKPQTDEPTTQEDVVEVEEETQVIEVEINGIEEQIVMDEKSCPSVLVNDAVQLTSDNKQLPKELFFGATAICEDTSYGMGRYYYYMSAVYSWRYEEHVNRNSPEKQLERKLARQKKAQLKTEKEIEALKK